MGTFTAVHSKACAQVAYINSTYCIYLSIEAKLKIICYDGDENM